MQQLGLTYFWPLTEQPELDLDYTPCLKYEEHKRQDSAFIGNRLDQWSVFPCSTTANAEQRICIDIDKIPVTIKSKDKPNFIKRYIYKSLGMKWESK